MRVNSYSVTGNVEYRITKKVPKNSLNKHQQSLNLLELIATNKVNRAQLTKILKILDYNDLLTLVNKPYLQHHIDNNIPSITWAQLQDIKKKPDY